MRRLSCRYCPVWVHADRPATAVVGVCGLPKATSLSRGLHARILISDTFGRSVDGEQRAERKSVPPLRWQRRVVLKGEAGDV